MITIIGSLNYDLVTYTNTVPLAGETIQANTFEKHLGGKGLNEALACARLRKSNDSIVRMVGNVGADSFGEELKLALVDASVDSAYVSTLEGQSSGVATILVEKSGENRILIVAGANGLLKPSDEDYSRIFTQDKVPPKHDFVVLQNEYPHTIESINWLKTNRSHINIAYNPSPFKADLISKDTLKNIDLLIVNEGEAMNIAEKVLSKVNLENNLPSREFFLSLASTLREFICQSNTSIVIITLGSTGCVYASKEKRLALYEPAAIVDHVLDTTGAGDTFFGGIVLQLSTGDSTLEEAIRFATVASSLAIQKRGAAQSIPYYYDVVKAL